MTPGRDWRLRARCRGLPTDLFYASELHQGSLRRAREEEVKQICLRCPVRAQCLAHALEHPERHGIWGATTPRERAALGLRGFRRPGVAG
ncbi:MAG: WhiB family transcriptional regulator [Actinomycetota bacterium]|nr:WhiB family transcriptional regulator [Actinomycetota bacterium]